MYGVCHHVIIQLCKPKKGKTKYFLNNSCQLSISTGDEVSLLHVSS